MTTKENFIQRYNAVRNDIIDAMDRALARAIGNNVLDFEKMEDNFADVYPLIGAVLQKQTSECLEGSAYESRRRQQKRQASKYRRDYRIWMDYAGDYRYNKNND